MSTNLNSGTYTIGDNLTDDFPSISVTSIDPGYIFTTNNTGASSWNWGNITTDTNLKGASIQIQGDAEFDGEVTVKGKNLIKMFEKIEERLAILHPNEKLEDKWDELKELGKRYKELEAEIIEKEIVWAILKK